jgi:hypothetical protein
MNTFQEIKIISGILYLLYGITKVSIGITLMVIPSEKIKNIPFLKLFAAEVEDKTFAGRLYEYALLIFGIYTIIFGLALFNIYPNKYREILENKYTEYSVFISIGLLLTIFYSLVLYTNLPISKDMKYKQHYKLLGLFGGISFLIMPFFWELIGFINPTLHNMTPELRSLTILGGSIIFIILLAYIYIYVKKNNIPEKKDAEEIIKSKIPINMGKSSS